MNDIRKLTISLLEKVEDSSLNAENSEEFIQRTSGSIDINDAISTFSRDVDSVDRENFIDTISDMIYKDLLDKTNGKYDIDSVGVFIQTDEDYYENSLSLSTLRDMSKYHEEINPVFELIKMSLPQEEDDS